NVISGVSYALGIGAHIVALDNVVAYPICAAVYAPGDPPASPGRRFVLEGSGCCACPDDPVAALARAVKGDLQAQFKIGQLYAHGLNVMRNLPLAVAW